MHGGDPIVETVLVQQAPGGIGQRHAHRLTGIRTVHHMVGGGGNGEQRAVRVRGAEETPIHVQVDRAVHMASLLLQLHLHALHHGTEQDLRAVDAPVTLLGAGPRREGVHVCALQPLQHGVQAVTLIGQVVQLPAVHGELASAGAAHGGIAGYGVDQIGHGQLQVLQVLRVGLVEVYVHLLHAELSQGRALRIRQVGNAQEHGIGEEHALGQLRRNGERGGHVALHAHLHVQFTGGGRAEGIGERGHPGFRAVHQHGGTGRVAVHLQTLIAFVQQARAAPQEQRGQGQDDGRYGDPGHGGGNAGAK
jgi:hypothetical protein